MQVKDASIILVCLALLAIALATGGVVFILGFLVTLLVIIYDLYRLATAVSDIKQNLQVDASLSWHEWYLGSGIGIPVRIMYSGKAGRSVRISRQIEGPVKVVKPMEAAVDLSPGASLSQTIKIWPIETGEVILHPVVITVESTFLRSDVRTGGDVVARITAGVGYTPVRSSPTARRAIKGIDLLKDDIIGVSGGTDFYTIRQYVPGDQLRNIDWVRSSREGKLFVKVFEDSHGLPVYFLLDLDPSMDTGVDMSELNSAICLTTRLANMLFAENTKFGLIGFSKAGIVTFKPPGMGRDHMLTIKTLLSEMRVVDVADYRHAMPIPINKAEGLSKMLSGVDGLEMLGEVMKDALADQVANMGSDGFVKAIMKACRSTDGPCQIVIITNLSMGVASLTNGIRLAGYYGHSVSVVLTPHIWYQDKDTIDVDTFYGKYLEARGNLSYLRNLKNVAVVDLSVADNVEELLYKKVPYGPAVGIRR